jgi:hypothetical protein
MTDTNCDNFCPTCWEYITTLSGWDVRKGVCVLCVEFKRLMERLYKAGNVVTGVVTVADLMDSDWSHFRQVCHVTDSSILPALTQMQIVLPSTLRTKEDGQPRAYSVLLDSPPNEDKLTMSLEYDYGTHSWSDWMRCMLWYDDPSIDENPENDLSCRIRVTVRDQDQRCLEELLPLPVVLSDVCFQYWAFD